VLRQANLYEQTTAIGPQTERLTGSVETDFLIIGAGYTGLTASIHAARAGTKTVIIEAQDIGFGGSGRNHGHCVPVLGFINPDAFIQKLGKERGERLTSLLVHSGAKVFSLVNQYEIACEAAPTGALQLAHHPASLEKLHRQAIFYQRLGIDARLLSRDEAIALTGSRAYHGGWLHPEGGHLNPLAFARGLARAALDEGAQIYTQSPAIAIKRIDGGWQVSCPQGQILAKRVGIATNAYSGTFMPPLGKSYFGVEAYALASEPIDPALRRHLLPENHNIGDNRPDVRYLRFDQGNRLIVGGLVETILGRNMGHTQNFMRRRFQELFPQLQDLRWGWSWSGRMAINLDRQPHLYHPAEGLFALVGYSGRGLPTATALGEVLGEAGCGTPVQDLPMEVTAMKRLVTAELLSFLVPRLRGPLTRLRTRARCF